LYLASYQDGDSTNATIYKNRYLALTDSIFDRQRMNAAKAKLFDYENRQNSAIIGRLTEHNHYLIVTSIVFLILAAVIALLYFKLRQRNRRLLESQQLLVAKNQELLRNGEENRQLRHRYIEAVDRNSKEQGENANTIPDDEASKDGKEMQLSTEQKIRLLEKINEVLDDVSVISREDFSLSMLAQKVESNTKYVSAVINETYGKNFKSYLNEFRIREACRRLNDSEHYGNFTIQAIYRELGYKTAAGFIQAFRKVNGMTPSQYQKLCKQRSVEEEDEREDNA
jgi:YesN/AraC family two-component response regulator